jgi:acid phosphatase
MGINTVWQNKQEHALDANLYMQTSAEYRAACIQTYNWATERLRQRVAAQPAGSKPPAVIMDLDETVVDNAAYQSFLDREDQNYSDAAWEKYERDFPHEVRLVAGAKGFIDAAEASGVTVILLSNRMTKNQDSTIEALKFNGISTKDIGDRLMLKDSTSDKTPRRQAAMAKYNVVMLVGDNLRDFSEEFVAPKLDYADAANREKGISERFGKVDSNAYRFGAEWVILPNPVYGEWQRVLGPNPRENLRKTDITPAETIDISVTRGGK